MINVAGHRLSTGQLEEVLQSHPNVAECAVVGVADALKGELPVGLVVLNRGVTDDDAARKFLSFFLSFFLPFFLSSMCFRSGFKPPVRLAFGRSCLS